MSDVRKIERVPVNEIVVPDGRRPLQEQKVAELADSMQRIGLLQPIIVRMRAGRPHLVSGLHRLNAARSLSWSEIECYVIEADDRRARMSEIAENLYRAELTMLERAEAIAEWVHLAEQDHEAISAQSAQKLGRGRPEGGRSRAAREIGVDRDAVRRAQKIAALPPEAKSLARTLGLDDHQAVLLKAATSGGDPATALQSHADRRPHTPRETERTKSADAVDRVATMLIRALGDDVSKLLPDLEAITTAALVKEIRQRRRDLFDATEPFPESDPTAILEPTEGVGQRIITETAAEQPNQHKPAPAPTASAATTAADTPAPGAFTAQSEIDTGDRPASMSVLLDRRSERAFAGPADMDCHHPQGTCGYSRCQRSGRCLAPSSSATAA